ncbi:LppU/SCO3897 family protein [Nocardia sp. R6R-6]|uniref:LppU/SCO3897 family protein n=1 Tax=Nocardia sp. R6R-6 TaxID=3459303 RepID=UPI00403DF694
MTDQPAADTEIFGNGIPCTVCGSTPAVHATFRAHRGLILFMQFRKHEGMFCRDCGMALFRKLQGDSLWQGWWSWLSLIINPIVLLCNLGERAQVRRLPAPIPGPHSVPLDPGKPLTERPQLLGLLLPVIGAAVVVAGAATAPAPSDRSHAYPPSRYPAVPTFPAALGAPFPAPAATPRLSFAEAGQCMWNKHGPIDVDDNAPEPEVVPCDDPRAQAEILGKAMIDIGRPFCDRQYPEADIVYTASSGGGNPYYRSGMTLCLRQLR